MEQFIGFIGVIAVLVFIIDTPWRKARARRRRIRQDAFDRGQAYWLGKHSVTQQRQGNTPAISESEKAIAYSPAEIVAPRAHEALGFKALAATALVAMVLGGVWMAYDVGSHRASASPDGGVVLAAQPAPAKAKKHTHKRTAVQELDQASCFQRADINPARYYKGADGACHDRGLKSTAATK